MDVVAQGGRQILSLVIVFSLLGWTVWKFGRARISLPWLKRAKEKNIQAVERLMLTQQHTLHVVEIGGRKLLIATHPGGVTLLTAEPRAGIAHA